MKFSENWLRSQIPSNLTHDELVKTLTAIGLEVEEVTPLGESLDGVVVAEIIDAQPHPEADRLQVCSVAFGGGEPVQIVCGAPNARVGLKTALAKVGAVLPGDFEIKPAKLRGIESFGMLCSGKEVGIDEGAAGIIEFPADAPVGESLATYLGLPDASIEIKLTPNRADCFGVRGIAYDVAAATRGEVATQEAFTAPVTSDATRSIKLHAGAAAPRYVGRVIEGLQAGATTPIWMQEALRRSGIRPLSFLVDVTQYVMMELGQPMHAFDNDKLQGEVGVRISRQGEKLQLLDGREVELDDTLLTVTDNDAPIALAGIMGGEASKVTDATTNVFLEAAHFAPANIMGQGRKFGMHTDASHRFERGVDPELPMIAIERATQLILGVAGGQAGPVVDVALHEELPQPKQISLRQSRLNAVLGVNVAEQEVTQILASLGLSPTRTETGWDVTAPTRRFDLEIEEDLIEEVARIYGYDTIPTTLPHSSAPLHAPTETVVSNSSLRRRLAARDYRENINYAFVDATLLAMWKTDAAHAVELANPLSAELAVMRPMLLPGLAAAAARNLARQQARVRFFELGNVFTKSGESATITDAIVSLDDAAPVHTQRIAAVAVGGRSAEQWNGKASGVDFYAVKGDLESLAELSGVALQFENYALPFAHPGRSAHVKLDNVSIGWIGQLHPTVATAMEIDAPIYGFEVDLAPLTLKAVRAGDGSISKFPSVRRDLAFVLPQKVAWSAVRDTIETAAGELLREMVLFDQYQGKGVAVGHKSLTIGLVLQDRTRTLTDADVEAVVNQVIAAMTTQHSAVIRS